MNDKTESPNHDVRPEQKKLSWYVDETGQVKGHTATVEVDTYVEFTDYPKIPSTKPRPKSI